MQEMAATPSTRADALRNRERIITAASSCFASDGVACQVAEIARQAGLGNATVFRHFPTKTDLIVAVMRRRMEELVDEVHAAAAVDDPGEALGRVVEALGKVLVRDAALKQMAAQRFEGDDGLIDCRDRIYECVDGLLSRCKAAGVVRADVETMDIALMLTGIAQAVSGLESIRPGLWRRYVALVDAAIRPAAAGIPLAPAAPTLADFEAAYGGGSCVDPSAA